MLHAPLPSCCVHTLLSPTACRLLRECWELEFASVRCSFPLDIERIVDDFVLMCMLVGNDFLPALPTLDISEGALNNIFTLYKVRSSTVLAGAGPSTRLLAVTVLRCRLWAAGCGSICSSA